MLIVSTLWQTMKICEPSSEMFYPWLLIGKYFIKPVYNYDEFSFLFYSICTSSKWERKPISIKITKINKVFAAFVPFSNKDASTTLGKAIVTLSDYLKNESWTFDSVRSNVIYRPGSTSYAVKNLWVFKC